MHTAFRHVVAFVAALALGGALTFLGLTERRVARAEEQAAAGLFDEPLSTLASAERVFNYATYLPLVGTGPRDELQAERLGLLYRQQRYGEIAREDPSTPDGLPDHDPSIQMMVTNAHYRDRMSRAKDLDEGLAVLGTAIDGYASILRSVEQSDDAAYNYEYLAKLKDDVQKKRRLPPVRPPEPEGLRGREGSLEEGGPAKIYIPMIDQERTRETPQNGDRPIKKKG
jgi:hypothetical protein